MITLLAPNTYTVCDAALIVKSLTNRKHFDPVALQALSDNIKLRGIDQPIIIRALPGYRMAETFDAHGGAYIGKSCSKPIYEIVSGERRYRAAMLAGLTHVPVILRQYTDLEAIEAQLVENIQRESLSELDEAEGFDVWLQQPGMTVEVITEKISRSRRYVFSRLQLLKLQPETKQALRANQIDVSRALLLAPVHDPKLQLKALEYAASTQPGGTPPSVRELTVWLRQNVMLDLVRAPFQITAANLMPLAGSCKACPKRTGANPDIFSHVDGADICTDPPCYNKKSEAHLAELQHQADKRGMRLVQGSEAKAICHDKSSILRGYSPLSQVREDAGGVFMRLDHMLSPSPAVPIEGAVLIENPFTRELIPAIPTAEAEAALLAKGLIKTMQATTEAAGTSGAASFEDSVKKIKVSTQFRIQTKYEELRNAAVLQAVIDAGDDAAESLLSSEVLLAHFERDLHFHVGKCILESLGLKDARPDSLTSVQIYKFSALWMAAGDDKTSEALAKGNGVDLDRLRKDAKEQIKAEVAAEIAALKPPVKPAKTFAPTTPLAQPSTLPVATAQTTKPAASRSKARLSAQDAQSGIAAAMQNLEAPPAGVETALIEQIVHDQIPSPQVKEQSQLAAGFAIGQRVQVTQDTDKLGLIASKHAGKCGTITGKEPGGPYWTVTFKGRSGGVTLFADDQIEAVQS